MLIFNFSLFNNFFVWYNSLLDFKISDKFFYQKPLISFGYANFFEQLNFFFFLKFNLNNYNSLYDVDLDFFIFSYFIDCLTFFFAFEKLFIMDVYFFIYYIFDKKFIMDFFFFFDFKGIEYILDYFFQFSHLKKIDQDFNFFETKFDFVLDFFFKIWRYFFPVNFSNSTFKNSVNIKDFDIYFYLDIDSVFFENYYFSFCSISRFFVFDFLYLKFVLFDFFYDFFFS